MNGVERLAKAIWDVAPECAETIDPEYGKECEPIGWEYAGEVQQNIARRQAEAACRFLGFVNEKGEVVCPEPGAVTKAVEALIRMHNYLLDGGPCYHEADGDEATCEVCQGLAAIDTALRALKGEK